MITANDRQTMTSYSRLVVTVALCRLVLGFPDFDDVLFALTFW